MTGTEYRRSGRSGILKLFCGMLILTLSSCAPGSDHEASRWDKEISAIERRMVEHPVPPGGIVFAGSSSIRLWDLQKSFGDLLLPLSNQGFGGSQLSDSVHFFPRIISPLKPSVIVVYAGDNDIASGLTAEEVADDFRQFVAMARSDAEWQPKVLFISIKPSLSRWKFSAEMEKANRTVSEICQAGNQLEFLDIWNPMLGTDGLPRGNLFQKDGLHLNTEGYELWESLLKPRLMAISGTSSR
ncbi:MAG: GDSL-type esterase/lipase family protein [Planctomyces sp.]